MSYLIQQKRVESSGKESIHSGHFMVSQFEAEEQDDEDNVAVPIPEVIDTKTLVPVKAYLEETVDTCGNRKGQQKLGIDQSLSKLFQCMSLAYRQKLTSPKWNRFRGIRLRWKDKIRLNNVIWRCWHLQFIKRENTLICQFASPLDVDTHNKPEAIVLEGKYWKRKLAAVTAEYKRWRMFYRNHLYGHTSKEDMDMLNDVDALLGDSSGADSLSMMIDEDYMGLMSDTLFSTITNQPFVFPDTRELAKSGLADFIQPSLGPLQPNLDDYMDTYDPLQDLYNSSTSNKLPTVPEEQSSSTTNVWSYRDFPELVSPTDLTVQVPDAVQPAPQLPQFQDIPQQQQPQPQTSVTEKPLSIQESHQNVMSASYPNVLIQPVDSFVQNSNYPIMPKIMSNSKPFMALGRGKLTNSLSSSSACFNKAVESNVVYQGFSAQSVSDQALLNDRGQVSISKTGTSQAHRTQVQELQSADQFKHLTNSQPTSVGYKFNAPGRPSIKFTSHATNQQVQQPQQALMHPSLHASPSYHPNFPLVPNENKLETRARGNLRGRGRSRSNTREPIKRPPLLSAASDTALISPQTNALLTQLLTANSPVLSYNANPSMGSMPDLSQHRKIKEEKSSMPVLPQSNTYINLPSQITVTAVPLTSNDSSYLSTYSNSDSPLDSPSQNLHSPTSSQGSIGSPGRDGSSRDRRKGHIHAEQKRRCNIKNGFDMIHSLIPQLNQNPNAKLSKAMMLQKGAEYIKQLRSERNQLKEEMDSLKQQIENLNTSISNCQSMLPATGAPVSRRGDSRMQEMFDEYVSRRTMDNWKFWIFSLICRPLLNSFNNFVSSSSVEDLYTSTLLWVEQHCTLGDLRPIVLNSLRYVCTRTEILTEPERLPEEVRQIVLKRNEK